MFTKKGREKMIGNFKENKKMKIIINTASGGYHRLVLLEKNGRNRTKI